MSNARLIYQIRHILDRLLEEEVKSTLADLSREDLFSALVARMAEGPLSPVEQLLVLQLNQDQQPAPVDQVSDTDVPEHVSVSWILGKLGIVRSTFYESVRDILLFPVIKIGIRPYYLKSDVIALFEKAHGKGPRIYGKLAARIRKENRIKP